VEITEIRIQLRNDRNKKLRAYATVTFDNQFVVRDIKVISGKKGLFVAMPSRKLKEPCPECGHMNVVRSRFCNQCGARIEGRQPGPPRVPDPRAEHRDIAHPITQEARNYIQSAVLEAYEKELARQQGSAPSEVAEE